MPQSSCCQYKCYHHIVRQFWLSVQMAEVVSMPNSPFFQAMITDYISIYKLQQIEYNQIVVYHSYLQYKLQQLIFDSPPMQAITLTIPKEVSFNSINGVEKLSIFNPTNAKLVIKIRTNHKTALSIHPTHDFIQPLSKKQIVIKLVELQPAVKLEVNYAIATEEMIAKNDSKMSGVDKKDIKKQIVQINVKNVKTTSSVLEKEKSIDISNDLNSSFATVVPQKNQTSKLPQKKSSLSDSANFGIGSTMKIKDPEPIVVQQHLEEDEYEYEQKMKNMKTKLTKVQKQIQQKTLSILSKREQLAVQASTSIIPHPVLLLIIIVAFLLGSFIKLLLF